MAERVVIVETEVHIGAEPGETTVSTTISEEPRGVDGSVEIRYEDGSPQGLPRESLDIEPYGEFGELQAAEAPPALATVERLR